MKRKRFSEEQIAFALRQADVGTTIADIKRESIKFNNIESNRKKAGGTGMGLTSA